MLGENKGLHAQTFDFLEAVKIIELTNRRSGCKKRSIHLNAKRQKAQQRFDDQLPQRPAENRSEARLAYYS